MGLFSSKKETFVSSSVYNLAGDEQNRVKYLKSTLVGASLAGGNSTKALNDAYIHGPGMDLRGFDRWCHKKGYYSYIGMDSMKINKQTSINITSLSNYLDTTIPSNKSIEIIQFNYGTVKTEWYIAKYILETHPELMEYDYEIVYPRTYEFTGIGAYAKFDDPSNTTVSLDGVPKPVGYSTDYLYVLYQIRDDTISDTIIDPWVNGTPNVNGLTKISDTGSVSHPVTLHKTTTVTVVNSSGSNTTTTNEDTNTSYSDRVAVYDGTRYIGYDPITNKYSSENATITHKTGNKVVTKTTVTVDEVWDETVTPKVWVSTTTTTVVEDVIESMNEYQKEYSTFDNSSIEEKKILIYKKGTGNTTLDALLESNEISELSFLPAIPLRINNYGWGGFSEELKTKSAKAFKKLTKSKITKLVEKIEENANIGDIDFCYLIPSISVNNKNRDCKKYIYAFFQYLMLNVQSSGQFTNFNSWLNEYNQAKNRAIEIANWMEMYGSADYQPGGSEYNPVIPPKPTPIPFPKMPNNHIYYRSSNATFNLHFSISWNVILEETGVGILDINHKSNSLWWEIGTTTDLPKYVNGGMSASFYIGTDSYTTHTLCWQVSNNKWKKLIILGGIHNNDVYQGKSVTIPLKNALLDEDESGFIIPLSMPIFKEAGLIKYTQVAVESSVLMFNCYEIVKTKWYQRGWFKTVIQIVGVYLLITTGTDGGMLGANATVGSYIGLSGTTAVIAGAILNTMAAMVVTTVITKAASKLIGGQLGQLIGTIVSMYVVYKMSVYNGAEATKLEWSEIMKADNIMKMSLTGLDKAAQHFQAETAELMQKSQELMEKYEKEMKHITEMSEQLIRGNGILDPYLLSLADAVRNESSESFLSRTLMTGSDIAAITHAYISEFTTINLAQELS